MSAILLPHPPRGIIVLTVKGTMTYSKEKVPLLPEPTSHSWCMYSKAPTYLGKDQPQIKYIPLAIKT